MALTNAEKSKRWRDSHPEYYEREDVKAAARERLRQWRKDNPKRNAEINRKHAANARAKYPDKLRSWLKAWRFNNKEAVAKYNRQYRLTNPGWNANKCQIRKARKLGNGRNDLTRAQWQQILEEFNFCCAYCLKPSENLQQEHMTPLARGGEHTMANVVPACRECNQTKHTKTLLEFVLQGPCLEAKPGVRL